MVFENCFDVFNEDDLFTFIWSIRKFSMCPGYFDNFISSPIITVSKYGNSEWCLELYPNGLKPEDYISCFLRCKRLGDDEKTISLKFCLSISSFEKQTEYDFKLNEQGGYRDFISVKDFLNDKNKYLPNDTLTIKCTMKCTRGFASVKSIDEEISYARNIVCRNSNLSIDQCCIETTIHVETKSVIWSIEKFRSLHCNKRLTLPVFSAMKDFPSFYVTVYKTSESPVTIQIRRKEEYNSINLYVRCRASVIDCEKDVKYCSEDEYFFEYRDEIWCFPPFFALSDLDKIEYFESTYGILYLQFDFAFSLDKVCHSEKSLCNPGFLANKSKLPAVKVFKSPATKDEHSIITLQAGDQTFEVHRTVLESSSDVFHAMLESDMKEKETGVVNITDVNPHILGQMLEFFYSNTVADLSPTDAMKLYAAGTKYQVKYLVSCCSSMLVSLLSVSTVCDILDLADLYQDQRLRKYAQDFVELNFDEILVSTEWADFMERSGTFAAKVLQKILTK